MPPAVTKKKPPVIDHGTPEVVGIDATIKTFERFDQFMVWLDSLAVPQGSNYGRTHAEKWGVVSDLHADAAKRWTAVVETTKGMIRDIRQIIELAREDERQKTLQEVRVKGVPANGSDSPLPDLTSNQ